jgi:hypothetical protein
MANHLLLHGLLLGASYFGIVLTTIQGFNHFLLIIN